MPFDIPDGYRAGLEDLARILTPARRVSVSEYAGERRILTKKQSAYPGPWRNDRVPYLVGFMDALDYRHPAPIVVVKKSAQSCFSDALLNWILRSIDIEPAPFLALWPTVEIGKSWIRTRVNPAINAIRGLRLRMTEGRKQTDSTLVELHWPGGVMFVGSANKPDDVARVSVPNIVLDDADRMPKVLAGEGDPFELSLMRQITFPRRKAVVVSTPTTEEDSRVEPLWQQSTMDRYFVPCVHCGHMQHLRFGQLKWTAGKPQTARYQCEDCAALMENRNKREMLAAGEWRSEHPEREESVKGFHINGLYAPVGLGDEWSRHAEAYERAQGSEGRLQVFFNTRLGEVHKGERKRVEWKELQKRADPYKLRDLPEGCLLLTSGSDVQADRIETQILGWGRGDRVWVIDYVVHYGDTTRTEVDGDGKPSVWMMADEYLARELSSFRGVPMRLECSMIDAGYLTDIVQKFTRARRARGIFACRGSSQERKSEIGRPSYPDTKWRGKIDDRGVERYELGVTELKNWLFEVLRADAGTADAPVLPTERRIRFSDELPETYYRQLTAETFDPAKGWIARANYHRNEALDTFCYARAAAMHHSIAVHRMREPDWARREQMYEPGDGAPKAKSKPEFNLPDGAMMPVAAIRKGN